MSSEEKSTWAVLIAMLLTYGWYFFDVLVTNGGAEYVGYQTRIIGLVVGLIVLIIIGHIAIAILSPNDAGASDERDKSINRFGEYVGGYVLGAATLCVLGMTMAELPYFHIAHAILGGLVLSEIVSSVVKIWRYRRGF